MKWVLVISSGTGPGPVRHFVSLLGNRFMTLCEGMGGTVHATDFEGEEDAPRSIRLQIEGSETMLDVLKSEVGTHALVFPSRERTKRSRKRWFASVAILPLAEQTAEEMMSLGDASLRFQSCRAKGPGGQNVNKRNTAVRVRHVPSGIEIRVQDQRSQRANLRIARSRIATALARRQALETSDARRRIQCVHCAVQRGAPVREYHLDETGALEENGCCRAKLKH